jgi:cellulase/cellobiase CelA1
MALTGSLVGVTAAALIGSLAPLNSTWAADRGSGAAAGPRPVDVLWSASPLGALTGSAVPRQIPPRAGQVPASTRPPNDLTAGKGGKHRKGKAGGDGRNNGHHRALPPRQPGTAGAAAGTSTSARAAGSAPPVVVSYFVDREWAGGFQGQVRVVNNGTRPISGWQAVIALPRDRVTWFWNADGFVSHHIMLLRPLSADEVVPGGGTLTVFFTATGPETTPQACAFDGISCG